MRIYWYWPWPPHRAIGLADGATRAGDTLTLHALDSRLSSSTGPLESDRLRVKETLPEPVPLSEWSPRWLIDRAVLVFARSRHRYRMVASGGFDICHVHVPSLFTDAWALRRLQRLVPLVTSVHDVFPHRSRFPTAMERALLAGVYRHGGHLVVHHERLRCLLTEHFDVEPERVAVIPHPIRPFRAGGDRRPSARDRETVLFFGTFRRNKGIPVLLRAMQELGETQPVRFRFAGRGAPELEELVRRRAAEDHRVEADIRYLSDSERDEAYQEADLVVLPYTSFASQSGVLADAYSHGVPVVVSDVGALGEAVREDRTGWVVQPGDPEELAEVLAAALRDGSARSRIRRRMEELAEARSEEAVGRAYRDLYERVLGG